MKTVKVLIERGVNGAYGAYIPDGVNLPFGISGMGDSVKAAIDDFLVARDDMQAYYLETKKEFPNLKFEFSYDIASFLSYYSDKLSLAGLERITGVAQGQLSHYVNGRRKPGPKTVAKIQKSLQEFGKDLSNVEFI